MLEILDKDFKAVTIKMLQQAITNTPKTDEKIECLSKEIDTKENQMDILEVENIINKKLSEWLQ